MAADLGESLSPAFHRGGIVHTYRRAPYLDRSDRSLGLAEDTCAQFAVARHAVAYAPAEYFPNGDVASADVRTDSYAFQRQVNRSSKVASAVEHRHFHSSRRSAETCLSSAVNLAVAAADHSYLVTVHYYINC